MQAIIDKMESEEEARASRAEVKAFNTNFKSKKKPYNNNKKFEERTCYFCKKIGSDKYKTHDTQFCRLRNKNKKPNQKFKSKSFNVGVENSPE